MARLREWFGDGPVLVLDVPLACCAIATRAAADGLPFASGIPEEDSLAWQAEHVPATTRLVDMLHDHHQFGAPCGNP